MATGSTVYAFKAALTTALAANGALSAVQVSHGYPGEALIEREAIFVDRVNGQHRIANIKAGRKQRDENYTLTVVVSVVMDDGTVATAEARALALLQEVEDTLADDPSIASVDGVVFATAAGFRLVSDQTSTGPACVIEFDIDVKARLI